MSFRKHTAQQQAHINTFRFITGFLCMVIVVLAASGKPARTSGSTFRPTCAQEAPGCGGTFRQRVSMHSVSTSSSRCNVGPRTARWTTRNLFRYAAYLTLLQSLPGERLRVSS